MTIMAKNKRVLIEEQESEESEVEEQVSEGDESENSEHADDEDSVDECDDDEGAVGNAGWADSIAKILKTNKPKGKKTVVLSKAKKITDLKKGKGTEQSAGFEVQTADGEIKEGKLEVEKEADDCPPPRKKKKDVLSCRVKPNILEKDRERTLAKIATKGVVQLFNAVKMQQKDISNKLEEAGPLEVRKEKVLKNIDKKAFLDILMGEKSEKVDEIVKQKQKKADVKDETWSVLRDDFMMGAKMKDWDKELELEGSEEEQMEIESD